MRLSKQAGVAGAVIAAVLLLLWLVSLLFPGPSPSERAKQLRDTLTQRVMQQVQDHALARADGYTYAVDVGQLLIFAARQGDRELYQAMHAIALEHLLIHDADDPYTHGFVAWRYKPGQPLDASGTTEALRLAQGLWIGSDRFEKPKDRNLAHDILQGYARHQTVDQGFWMIRNYFNLQTRAFANNSYLIDYDPDLLADIAQATNDANLEQIAQQSAALMKHAVTPAGLLHAVIQPELTTLMPQVPPIFSPNNIEHLGNVAAVAQRSVQSTPAHAQRVLDFAMAHVTDLKTYYNAQTSEAIFDTPATINTLAPLLQLAVKLQDRRAQEVLLALFLQRAQRLPQASHDTWLHDASEALLAIQAVEQHP